MKFILPILALCIAALSQTSCKNAEEEQRKRALDTLTAIRRVAASLELISPLPGAPFGSNESDANFAIAQYNILNHNLIKDFKYDKIEPYYFENGLMEIKIFGEEHSWEDFDREYEALQSCIDLFNEKYGDPTHIDSTLQKKFKYDEAIMFVWRKGDKKVSIRIISDYNRFLFEIDILSDKMHTAYFKSVVDGTSNLQ